MTCNTQRSWLCGKWCSLKAAKNTKIKTTITWNIPVYTNDMSHMIYCWTKVCCRAGFFVFFFLVFWISTCQRDYEVDFLLLEQNLEVPVLHNKQQTDTQILPMRRKCNPQPCLYFSPYTQCETTHSHTNTYCTKQAAVAPVYVMSENRSDSVKWLDGREGPNRQREGGIEERRRGQIVLKDR